MVSHEGGKRTDTLCFCERLACALCGEVGGSFITQQVSFLSSHQIDYQIILVRRTADDALFLPFFT